MNLYLVIANEQPTAASIMTRYFPPPLQIGVCTTQKRAKGLLERHKISAPRPDFYYYKIKQIKADELLIKRNK